MSAIADNIRKYRKLAGLKQSDIAEAVGLSAQAVSKWELGKAEPDNNCIEILCKLFNVTANDLIGIKTVSTDPWNPDDMDYADREDETIRILARGVYRMSPENREKLLGFARSFFSEDFDEQGNKR